MNKKPNEDEALKLLLSYMGYSEKFTDMWDYDITFCPNKECHLFSKCLRNTDRLKDYPYPVSMCGFKPDDNGNCEHYIPQECKTNKTKGRKNGKR
jgi:hypothetical protein